MAYERILVPLDGSATSGAGLKQAIALAKGQGSKLLLLHVIDEMPLFTYPDAAYVVDDWMADLARAGQDILDRARRLAEAQKMKVEISLVESRGRPVSDVITAEARRWRAQLIVIGTHGRRGMNRLVMGSDAELVVRNTTVPVLLVHGVKEPKRAVKRPRRAKAPIARRRAGRA